MFHKRVIGKDPNQFIARSASQRVVCVSSAILERVPVTWETILTFALLSSTGCNVVVTFVVWISIWTNKVTAP